MARPTSRVADGTRPPLSVRPSTSAIPTRALPAWAAVCFFVSGAAGLLYEVVWSKQLSVVLGNSLHAISTVVAAFLCGLALGAWWLGRRLVHRAAGARRYALLELGIAALGLCSLAMPVALGPVIGALGGAFALGSAAFAFVRFVVVFASLLPPTLLMGATLPVLVEHFEHALVGPALSWLYAINTFGAVAGSLAGGFALIPGLGLRRTTIVAAALNVAAGAIAWRFAGASRAAAEASADAAAEVSGGAPARHAAGAVAPLLPRDARVLIGVMLAISGFAALAFQIAWVRLFGLLLGSSVYSFSGVLGVYLVGLAIGSMLAGRFLLRLDSLAGFAAMQAGIALSAAGAVWLFPGLPERFLAIVQAAGTNWWSLFGAELVLVAAVILVPCVLLGAVFPVAARLLSAGDGGRAVGRAYAANTLGTIAGSLAAGYVMVPRLGVQGTHVAALALSALVALLALAAAARARALPGATAGAVAGALALAAVLAGAAPAWQPIEMSAGVFRPAARAWIEGVSNPQEGGRIRSALGREKLLLYREGLNGSVLVTRDTLGRNTVMRINGKTDASDNDMLTQVLSGLVPGALADSGARTLVIGQGSGVTLESVLAAGAGRTDLAEIEPAVIEGSRFFQEPGRDPLADPRVHVVLDDGRTVLAQSRERYGLIVSEPSNPWMAGVNNLFTLDFYRLVRARLERGGVFAQWIQLYEISPATFRSILGAFLEVFPRGNAFVASERSDLILVACDDPRPLSLARLRAPQVAGPLRRAKLLGPEAVGAFWIGTFDSLHVLAAGATFNTDDRRIAEYRAPRDLIERSRVSAGSPLLTGLLPRGEWREAAAMFAPWGDSLWLAVRARQLARGGWFDVAESAVADARACGRARMADDLVRVIAGERAGQAVAKLLPRARGAAQAGRNADALALLEQAAAAAPGNARVRILLADQQRQTGDPQGALASLDRAVALGDAAERRDAHLAAGLVLIAAGRAHEAAERFALARAADPRESMAYAFEARARFDAGEPALAEAVLQAGLRQAPDDPRLAEVAAAIRR